MEFLQTVQHAEYHVLLWKNCGPEMIGSWFLTKSTPGDDADASVFKQLEGIVDIRCLAVFLGLRDRLLRQMELREGVHGAPDLVAGEALDRVEGVRHELRALGKRCQGGVLLLHELLVRCLA